MNRQARVIITNSSTGEAFSMHRWDSYGEVTFFEAIKQHALLYSNKSYPSVKLSIEVRDEHDPSIPPAVYHVEVTREVRILNPRRDADKPKTFWDRLWSLVA
jgi:hypothetical protein